MDLQYIWKMLHCTLVNLTFWKNWMNSCRRIYALPSRDCCRRSCCYSSTGGGHSSRPRRLDEIRQGHVYIVYIIGIDSIGLRFRRYDGDDDDGRRRRLLRLFFLRRRRRRTRPSFRSAPRRRCRFDAVARRRRWSRSPLRWYETHERRQLDEIRTGGTVFVVFVFVVFDFHPGRSHRCVDKWIVMFVQTRIGFHLSHLNWKTRVNSTQMMIRITVENKTTVWIIILSS